MSRAHLLKFFRQHYRPDRVVIAAVGDLSHEKLTEAFRPLTRGRWPGRPSKGVAHELEPAPRPKHGHWWVKKPTEQVHLLLGFDAYRHNSAQRISAALLNIYLGVGMSSRLFQEIREKRGLAYTVYSFLHPFMDSGLMTIYVGTGATQVRECLRVIKTVLDDLSTWLLTDSEVRAVQTNIKGNMLLASDDVESRMHAIASQEIFHGNYNSVEDVCREIDRVQAADLRRVARHLFRSSSRTLLGVGPSSGVTSGKLHELFAG